MKTGIVVKAKDGCGVILGDDKPRKEYRFRDGDSPALAIDDSLIGRAVRFNVQRGVNLSRAVKVTLE